MKAIDLDRKIQRCYRNHSNRFIITNEFIVQNFEDKKKVLLVQVYQIILKIIEENKLIDYYQDYIIRMRKGSEEDIPTESPYMIRKRKQKQFIRKENRRIGSPPRLRQA